MDDIDIYDYYVLFPNHQEGLRLHQRLKNAKIKCTIVPTPREASKSCGISLLIGEECVAAVREIIGAEGINANGIARIKHKSGFWNRTC